MAIIFTFGISDTGMTRVRPDPQGQLNIHTDGNCNAMGAIDLGKVRAMPIVFYGSGVRQPEVVIPEKPSLVFNQISDGDTHRTALKHCHTLCKQLNLPVINRPEKVIESTRDRVAEKLADVPGVIMPRTIIATPDSPEAVVGLVEEHGLGWPVILRIVGDHNANSILKVDGPEDIDKLHGYGFDGTRFYLTQWVDYSGPDGLFLKQRIAMIDGEPVLRHSLFSENWMINSDSVPYMLSHPERGAPEALATEAEERMQLAADALAEIHRRIGLDFFGIDCHIDEKGNILVFEANANMEMLMAGIEALSHRAARVRGLLQNLVQKRSGESLN